MNKIKILFLPANPTSLNHLRLYEEAREIERKIKVARQRDIFEFKTQLAIGVDNFQQALLRYQPNIVHLNGHGSSEEGIFLEDKLGHSQLVGPKTLAQLFALVRDNARIVILNACYSKSQAQAISKVIDYTVGMSNAIGDEAAVAFSASFYEALGFGRSVKEAFDLARISLMISAITEDNLPEIIIRKGTKTSGTESSTSTKNIQILGNMTDSAIVSGDNNSILERNRGGGDVSSKGVSIEPDRPWPRD